MKKWLMVLLVIITFVGCGSQKGKEMPLDDLVKMPNELFYEKGSKDPFTGTATRYRYDNDYIRLRAAIETVDGKVSYSYIDYSGSTETIKTDEGWDVIIWNDNNYIEKGSLAPDMKRSGEWKVYSRGLVRSDFYNSGILQFSKKDHNKIYEELKYKSGENNDGFSVNIHSKENKKYTGAFEGYYVDGTKHKEAEYKEGILHGESTDYYPNGKISSKSIYKEGLIQGAITNYYLNGKVASIFQFKNENNEYYNNKTEFFYFTGKKMAVFNYNEKRRKDGEQYYYDDKGEEIILIYKDGFEV